MKTYGNKTCFVYRSDLSGEAVGWKSVGQRQASALGMCRYVKITRPSVYTGDGEPRFLLSLNLFAILETLIGGDIYGGQDIIPKVAPPTICIILFRLI